MANNAGNPSSTPAEILFLNPIILLKKMISKNTA
jgi:hypothetical protein